MRFGSLSTMICTMMMICAATLALVATSAAADPVKKAGHARSAAPPPDDGYHVPYVAGADGRKHSVMEIPGSVTVIPRKVIDDQQATTLGEVLRNSAGVTVVGR